MTFQIRQATNIKFYYDYQKSMDDEMYVFLKMWIQPEIHYCIVERKKNILLFFNTSFGSCNKQPNKWLFFQ